VTGQLSLNDQYKDDFRVISSRAKALFNPNIINHGLKAVVNGTVGPAGTSHNNDFKPWVNK
jgi:hypothetical protein